MAQNKATDLYGSKSFGHLRSVANVIYMFIFGHAHWLDIKPGTQDVVDCTWTVYAGWEYVSPTFIATTWTLKEKFWSDYAK